jgi:DNA-binding response OmpR family regulator
MSGGERRILVVTEDETRLGSFLKTLRGTPHHATVARAAVACRKLETGLAADLLVVDIEPPELTAFDAVKAYHRMLGPERPVLALSHSFKREHIEGMLENVGVRRLLPLNVRPEEMLFWVNNALFPEAMRSRKAPRIPAAFTLSIAERRRVLRGRAFTLSEDGLFLETSLAAEPGQVLELRFRLPGLPARGAAIVARCEVVWANSPPGAGETGHPPFGLGLRFVELEEAGRHAIKSYVMQSLIDTTI